MHNPIFRCRCQQASLGAIVCTGVEDAAFWQAPLGQQIVEDGEGEALVDVAAIVANGCDD